MRIYPQWFIDELVNEEDKERAISGDLKTTESVKFECSECKSHYTQIINNHIKISTGERKSGCIVCGKKSAILKISKMRLDKNKSIRVYPQWFIDELDYEEDKGRARSGELKTTERVVFKCLNCGNTYSSTVTNHVKLSTGERKSGCPICSRNVGIENRLNSLKKNRSYSKFFLMELFDDEDRIRAEHKSINTNEKVKFKCLSCGTIYEQLVWNHLNRKINCPHCIKQFRLNKRIEKRKQYPEWFIDELVNEEDKERARIKLLSTKERVTFKCDKCEKYYTQTVGDHINLSNGSRKHGCPNCIEKYNRSKVELEIEEYVKSIGYNTEHKRFKDSNDRLFEVDIFIPERNVGIEYNGSYYHNIEQFRINEDYHYNKFNECRKQNILLITIFDIEWNNREEEIKRYIKDILEGRESSLSYNKEGYMNNNYPSWKYYLTCKQSSYSKDYYIYNKLIVYTCGYSVLG